MNPTKSRKVYEKISEEMLLQRRTGHIEIDNITANALIETLERIDREHNLLDMMILTHFLSLKLDLVS